MKEQAERENRNLNDLVVERYGVRIIATLHLFVGTLGTCRIMS